MSDVEAPLDRDRSLPWRTLAAVLVGATAGVAMAYGITCVLAAIATPALARYIRSAHLDAGAVGLPFFSATGGSRLPPYALWLVIGVAGFLLPFLFNRRFFSRRVFSLAGVGKLLLALALLGLVGILAGAAVDPSGAGAAPAEGLSRWSGWLVRVGLAGLGMGLYFVVAGERTLGGTLDHWRNPDLGLGGAFAGLLAGLVLGAGLALVGEWMARPLGTFSQAMLGFLGESPEPSRLGWTRILLGYSLALGLFFAALGAVPVALGPSAAPRGRRLVALFLAALPVAAIFGVGTWFQRWAMDRGEMRFPSLAAAADLEPAPRPRLLALPGAAGPRVFTYPLDAVAYGVTSDEPIAATVGNVGRLKSYLEQRHGRWTLHSTKAWTAIPAIHDRLFQVDEAVTAAAAIAESPGFVIHAQLLAARLPHMPLSPAVRDASTRLLDPARFTASGPAKARLSAVALNLGDVDRARRLWREALAEGFQPDGALREPTAAPQRDGRLAGTVTVGGHPARGVRVVLYRAPAPFKLDAVPSAIRVLAAVDTDIDGRFAFSDLDARVYHLGVLLPAELGAAPGGATVTGQLGPFDLAAGPRQVDAGVIAVSTL